MFSLRFSKRLLLAMSITSIAITLFLFINVTIDSSKEFFVDIPHTFTDWKDKTWMDTLTGGLAGGQPAPAAGNNKPGSGGSKKVGPNTNNKKKPDTKERILGSTPIVEQARIVDLVQYYNLNITDGNGNFELLSPLSKNLLSAINDTKLLEHELSDFSPKYNPWKQSPLEPESIAPLVRPDGYIEDLESDDGLTYNEKTQEITKQREEEEKKNSDNNNENKRRKVKAALVSLVRNEELKGILQSITRLEETFNSKFNYPWVFFNDEPFTAEFKKKTQAATKSVCKYVHIPASEWNEPEWIDTEKAANLSMEMSEKENVQYAEIASYHRMCRWNSGPFFNSSALKDYDYYWRVEPGVNYFCSIDYDVFAYMQDNNKDYGFVISVYDTPQTMKTLWPNTVEFFQQHPAYVHPNNSRQWLLQDARRDHNKYTGGYSTCHFWSNFEIGRLDFFRSIQYQEYFKYLDETGGFFYERWGDAPVHSLALALMTDKSRIHWFKDIGYVHVGYTNCHASNKCSNCVPGRFTHWTELNSENCINEWFRVAGDG